MDTRHSCLRMAIILVILGLPCLAAAQSARETTPDFSGSYTSLLPYQKRLVDDWFRRFSETIGKPVSPEEGYNHLPVSAKTTFSAVTHALTRTKLTDQSGKTLESSAVSIIDKVDSVAGDLPGTRGDMQFRIYVQLRSGTQDLLSRSREFGRRSDNAIYHKGYPICFRSNTGTPSIQVSMSRDGKRADIDVDYRSSKFPAFLLNGHLSASNSDVRAGDNDDRHNRTWAGLQNWWRSLLGLPLLAQTASVQQGEVPISQTPKTRDSEKPEAAVYDFLSSWLVEQKPNEAMAYVAPSCYACLDVESGQTSDRGMARYKLLLAMMEANKRLGKVSSLEKVSRGIRLAGERIRAIQQPHHAQFVLYEVREDLAEQFLCPNQLDPSLISQKALHSKDFGKYVGAVFELKSQDQTSRTLALLWAREGGYWKLASYDVDPVWTRSQVPNLQTATVEAAPSLTVVAGDSQMVKAATQFLETWLVHGQVDQAFQQVSNRCYDCYNVYRDEGKPKAQSAEEAARLLRQGMEAIAQKVGNPKTLADGLEAPEPQHEDLKLVKHPAGNAFMIVSLPDYMAEAADCSRLSAAEQLRFVPPAGEKKYGNYYATGFRFRIAGPEASVLWLVWGKEQGSWKVLSYAVMTP